jgi:hypothetical protein
MRTYTTEELRESLLAMSIYMAEEVPQDTLKDDYDDDTGAWWLVASEFVEWCVKHKGGVLLFEFLCDAGRADNDEMGRLLKAILEDNEEGGE